MHNTKVIDLINEFSSILDGNAIFGLVSNSLSYYNGLFYFDSPIVETDISQELNFMNFKFTDTFTYIWFYYKEFYSQGLILGGNIIDRDTFYNRDYFTEFKNDINWNYFSYGYYDIEIFVDYVDKDGKYTDNALRDCGIKVFIDFKGLSLEDFDLCKKDDKGKVKIKYIGYSLPEITIRVIDADKYYKAKEPNVVIYINRYIKLTGHVYSYKYFIFPTSVVEDLYLIYKPYPEYINSAIPVFTSFLIDNYIDSVDFSTYYNAEIDIYTYPYSGFLNLSDLTMFKGLYTYGVPLGNVKSGFFSPFPLNLYLFNVKENEEGKNDTYILKFDIEWDKVLVKFDNLAIDILSINNYCEPVYDKITDDDREKIRDYFSYYERPDIYSDRIKSAIEEFNYINISNNSNIPYYQFINNQLPLYDKIYEQKFLEPILKRKPNFVFYSVNNINFMNNYNTDGLTTYKIPLMKKLKQFKISASIIPNDYVDVYIYDIFRDRFIKLDSNFTTILDTDNPDDFKDEHIANKMVMNGLLSINEKLTINDNVYYEFEEYEINLTYLHNINEWYKKVKTYSQYLIFLIGLKIKDNVNNVNIAEALVDNSIINQLEINFLFEVKYETYDIFIDVNDETNNSEVIYSFTRAYLIFPFEFNDYYTSIDNTYSRYYHGYLYRFGSYSQFNREHIYYAYMIDVNQFLLTFMPFYTPSFGGGGV